jgi:hypothetical protein
MESPPQPFDATKSGMPVQSVLSEFESAIGKQYVLDKDEDKEP